MKIFQWQIWQEKKSVWLDWESIPGCSLDHFIYTTEYSNSNGSRMNSHQVSFYGPDIWGLPTHYKGLSITHLPHGHLFLICRGLPHDLSFPQSSRIENGRNFTENQIDQLRRLGGWSPRSAIVHLYVKRIIKEYTDVATPSMSILVFYCIWRRLLK